MIKTRCQIRIILIYHFNKSRIDKASLVLSRDNSMKGNENYKYCKDNKKVHFLDLNFDMFWTTQNINQHREIKPKKKSFLGKKR